MAKGKTVTKGKTGAKAPARSGNDITDTDAAEKKAAVNAEAAERAEVGGAAIELTFVDAEEAKEAAVRLRERNPEWAKDMEADESLEHPNAINRSV